MSAAGTATPGERLDRRAPAPDVDSASADYAGRFAGEIGHYFLEVQTAALLRLSDPWRQGTVLDVGGGHAQVAHPLAAAGAAVTVTGSSPACRDRLDATLPPDSFRFVCCDLLDLPFPDKSFDVVTAFRLLPHVDRWREFVSGLCRIARYAVIVDYPDLRSVNIVQRPLFRLKCRIERNTRPFRCFTRSEIRASLEEEGFGQTEFVGQFLMPMALHRAHGSVGLASFLERAGAAAGATAWAGSPVIVRGTTSGSRAAENAA